MASSERRKSGLDSCTDERRVHMHFQQQKQKVSQTVQQSINGKKKKILICPPLWILTRWHSRLNSKRALLQRLSRDMAPELILDLRSPLAKCPTAPWLNAFWHIFNGFVTFFLYSWIYIRGAGVSREALMLPFHSSSLMLSFSCRVPPFPWQREMCKESWSVNPPVMTELTLCLTHREIYIKCGRPPSESLLRLDDQSCWILSAEP